MSSLGMAAKAKGVSAKPPNTFIPVLHWALKQAESESLLTWAPTGFIISRPAAFIQLLSQHFTTKTANISETLTRQLNLYGFKWMPSASTVSRKAQWASSVGIIEYSHPSGHFHAQSSVDDLNFLRAEPAPRRTRGHHPSECAKTGKFCATCAKSAARRAERDAAKQLKGGESSGSSGGDSSKFGGGGGPLAKRRSPGQGGGDGSSSGLSDGAGAMMSEQPIRRSGRQRRSIVLSHTGTDSEEMVSDEEEYDAAVGSRSESGTAAYSARGARPRERLLAEVGDDDGSDFAAAAPSRSRSASAPPRRGRAVTMDDELVDTRAATSSETTLVRGGAALAGCSSSSSSVGVWGSAHGIDALLAAAQMPLASPSAALSSERDGVDVAAILTGLCTAPATLTDKVTGAAARGVCAGADGADVTSWSSSSAARRRTPSLLRATAPHPLTVGGGFSSGATHAHGPLSTSTYTDSVSSSGSLELSPDTAPRSIDSDFASSTSSGSRMSTSVAMPSSKGGHSARKRISSEGNGCAPSPPRDLLLSSGPSSSSGGSGMRANRKRKNSIVSCESLLEENPPRFTFNNNAVADVYASSNPASSSSSKSSIAGSAYSSPLLQPFAVIHPLPPPHSATVHSGGGGGPSPPQRCLSRESISGTNLLKGLSLSATSPPTRLLSAPTFGVPDSSSAAGMSVPLPSRRYVMNAYAWNTGSSRTFAGAGGGAIPPLQLPLSFTMPVTGAAASSSSFSFVAPTRLGYNMANQGHTIQHPASGSLSSSSSASPPPGTTAMSAAAAASSASHVVDLAGLPLAANQFAQLKMGGATV